MLFHIEDKITYIKSNREVTEYCQILKLINKIKNKLKKILSCLISMKNILNNLNSYKRNARIKIYTNIY